ncbi:hypothetical protein, partial [Agrobacterium vitis]
LLPKTFWHKPQCSQTRGINGMEAAHTQYMHIIFSNHYRLTASLAAVFGDEPKEKYVGDIILSVNDCGEGMLIRFLRRWPLLIGAPDEATANPAIMTLRHGSQMLTWQFEHQDAEI